MLAYLTLEREYNYKIEMRMESSKSKKSNKTMVGSSCLLLHSTYSNTSEEDGK